jgi:phage repressor protein C with HTH and peptisase S24 domain
MSIHEGEILRKFLREIEISPEIAAEKMGVAKGTVYNWQDKPKLTSEQKDKLRKAGYRPPFEQKYNQADSKATESKEPGSPVIQKQIPIFELDVSASNIQLFSDGPEVISGYMSFPGFEDCDFGIYVRGDSMYPTYKNGYAIACKRINDMEIIQYGEPYLIITAEQRMVKRLQKGSDKQSLLCKSDNPSTYEDGRKKFEDFEIPRKKILRLYLVKGEANRSQI